MRIEDGYQIFEKPETIIVQEGDEWRYPGLPDYAAWRAFGAEDYGKKSTVPALNCQYRRPVTNPLEIHFI
jgi:hypothetical protein